MLKDNGQVHVINKSLPSEDDGFTVDWLKRYRGIGSVVLHPKTVDEIVAIVKYCGKEKLAIVPQGGNTGLVGGSVPVFDEIILSMTKMNKIIGMSCDNGSVVAEAGVILQTLNDYVCQYNCEIPLDLAAKGSCQIGGNVSTNAGGLHYIRHGSLRGTVLGIEAVTGNGDVINTLTNCRKHSLGPDLTQLFIGGEGALGIITKVAITVKPKVTNRNMAFIGVSSINHVLALSDYFRSTFNNQLYALELMDRSSLEMLADNTEFQVPNELKDLDLLPYYILIEVDGISTNEIRSQLEDSLAIVIDKKWVVTAVVAQDERQSASLWMLREMLFEATVKDSVFVINYDITLDSRSFLELIDLIRRQFLSEVKRVAGYAHLGDGNLHLNVITHTHDKELEDRINTIVYRYTIDRGGCISAEHGIGFQKRIKHANNISTVESQLIHQIKAIFDPHNILNPYKTVPPQIK